ncbi:hypothetical protein BIZ35_02060 [Heyndrickxia coagulans]|nr:hypothetical protein BIZ35_02060 [Heyndrickxia coagulans]
MSLKPTETKTGPKKKIPDRTVSLSAKTGQQAARNFENRRQGQEANLLVPAFAFLKPEKTGTAGGNAAWCYRY